MQEQIHRQKAEIEKKQLQIQTLVAESGMIRNKFDAINKQTLAFMGSLSTCENQIIQLKAQVQTLDGQLQETEREKQARRDQIQSQE